METFEMTSNTTVTLLVKISSDAIVGSYVKLDGSIIKRSTLYSFKVDLGNSNDLKDKELSITNNFFTNPDIINDVFDNTEILYTITDGTNTKEYVASKEKVTSRLFIAYKDILLA